MISKKYFLADGSTTNFLSDYIIKNDEYCRVYVSDSYELPVSAEDRAALLANVSQWELVNNNVVFYEAPAAGKYVTVWVASTPEELDTYIDYAFITYDNIANIETVVDNMDSVTTVAGDTTSINTIITNLSDINDVAAIDSAISAVNDISTEVVAVADIKQEIINVDSNSADISTVATYNADVSIVSGSIGAVQSVASDITNVNTVATNIADVSTVADNVADVTNFADVYYGPSATAPTTRRDGSALQAGDLWFDTANGYIKVYTGTDWLQASVQGASREVITATEGQTSVLVSSGYNVDQIDVYLNGQKMITGSDFTATDGQYITFLYGLQAGDKVEVISMASIATDEANLIQRVTFTADGATATFDTTHTLVSKSSIMVSVNGIVQNAAAFSVSGTTFTMNETPEDGDVLDVMVFGVSPTSIIQQAESIIYTPVGETSTNVQAHLEDVDANKQDRVYTPSGTGAVARTVESKLGETVSVKDFGAVGDGVTDDTAAIQAAVDSVTSNKGGNIYFPVGTYIFTSTISADDEFVNFVGAGPSATILKYSPTVAGVAFNLSHTVANEKAFSFTELTISTDYASAGTSIKISAKLTSATTQINGQLDTLYMRRVRIIQEGTGYWTTFIHSQNNGGVHLSQCSFDNDLTTAQANSSVSGIKIESTDSRVSVIRALTATDIYILRTAKAIEVNAVSGKQIESLYITNSEIVGISDSALHVTGQLGALGLTNVHVDTTNKIIDSTSGNLLIGRLNGCDLRKGANGGSNVAGPMMALDAGELFEMTGCMVSGYNHVNPNAINRFLLLTNAVTGVPIMRSSFTGNSFRNLNIVYGPSLNCDITTSGNTYNVIADTVIEEDSLDNRIAFKDGILSKSILFSLNNSGRETVTVTIPDGYYNYRWPTAFLQQASTSGSDTLTIEYDFDNSTPSSCKFIITGNLTARAVRFSFLALGVNERPVLT